MTPVYAGDDDGRVLHRAVRGELVEDGRDGRLLLPDGDVEAVNVLALLVDDRVDRDRGLAGLTVVDDELALTAADRDHRVDGLDARLERLLDRLAGEDARRLDLDAAAVRGLDRALAVDRHAERVDDAADERLADGHLHDAARALDARAFLHVGRLTEERGADVVRLEVEREAHETAGELEQLAAHDPFEAVDARDTVADAEDGAGLGRERGALVGLDLPLDEISSARSCMVGSSSDCRESSGGGNETL